MNEVTTETENLYVALIAGGQGARLFPMSHDLCPKQFCPLDSTQTFIQATTRRFVSLGIRPSNVIVITTNPNQTKLAKEQLLQLGVLSQNVYEIDPHLGYAGAMVKAAEFIYELDKTAVVINTPADQFIISDDNFIETMNNAVESAREGCPTLVGVKVMDLNTVMGCGHARYDADEDALCKAVTGFVEKPAREEADKLMRKGNSACNTGINVWQAATVLDAAGEFLQMNEDGLNTDELMELLGDLKVAVGTFGWYDCGTLKSLYDISKKTPNHKNASLGLGTISRHNCRRSLFYSIEQVEIHASGAEDVAVAVNEVNGRMVVAIVRLDDSQKVRDLAEDYQKHKGFLTEDFSMGARNNRVSTTSVSEEIRVGFVGVRDYTVTAIKYNDGKFVIIVSNDSAHAAIE
ncbi:MAG: sugar phosphate nucleotidyltransferase [Candidatus Saccharimonadales bacterium]